MTEKERFIMGRADCLRDTKSVSLTEGSEIAEKEWDGTEESLEEDFQEFRAKALNAAIKEEKDIVTEWLNEIGYDKPVGYYRNFSTMEFEIYTTKPGVLIGRSGDNIRKFEKMLSERYCHPNWKVKIIEIRGGIAEPTKNNEHSTVKLKDLLEKIGGGTYIWIYVDNKEMFAGKMCAVSKSKWDKIMGEYMDRDIIRLNTTNGAITIAV